MDVSPKPSESLAHGDSLLPIVTTESVEACSADIASFSEFEVLLLMQSENPELSGLVRGYINAIYEKDGDTTKMRDMCTVAAIVYKLLRDQAEAEQMDSKFLDSEDSEEASP